MAVEGLGKTIPPSDLGVRPEWPTEEALHLPAVLNGMAHDIGRKHQRREGDYYITPPVEVESETLAVRSLIRIGYIHHESENTIFAIDDDGMKPWYRLGRQEVTRGDGAIVETLEERKTIRGVLSLAEAALDQSVMDKLRTFDAAAFMDEHLSAEIRDLEVRLMHLKGLREKGFTAQQNPLKLDIKITSGWEHEGEQSPRTEYDGTLPLEYALEYAANNFKRINGRSDVQGEPNIIIRQGHASYDVSKEVWARFFQVISGSANSSEQMALDYARKDAS